jgi:LEA14-like dessication related protein
MRYGLFLFVIIFLGSCKIQSPEFKKMETWSVSSASTERLMIDNQIVLYNPNNVKGIQLKKICLAIDINSKNIGDLEKEYKMIIPSRSEFKIPVSIQLKSINSLLSSMVTIFSSSTSEIELSVKGFAEFKYFLFKRNIPVQYHQKINLNSIININK